MVRHKLNLFRSPQNAVSQGIALFVFFTLATSLHAAVNNYCDVHNLRECSVARPALLSTFHSIEPSHVFPKEIDKPGNALTALSFDFLRNNRDKQFRYALIVSLAAGGFGSQVLIADSSVTRMFLRRASRSVGDFIQPTEWEVRRWGILGSFALCVIEAAVILGLLLKRGRRAAAAQMQRVSAEHYARVFCSSPVAIVRMRRSDATILEGNDRWMSLVGRRPGATPMNLCMEVEDGQKLLRQLQDGDAIEDFETKLRVQNSAVRWVTISGEPVTINNEPCVLAVIHDVTKQKETEKELRNTERELQRLASQLIHSQEEERRRIAAELHDSLGQGLMIIKNRALICLRDKSNVDMVGEQLEELLATATATIEEARAISHNLRPYELDRLGLNDAVQSMLDRISGSTSLRLSSDLDSVDGLLSQDAEFGIYRIVQEGLTNVVRHADATDARVTIKRADAQVIVTVTDNGSGHIARANNKAPNGKGFGLAGIAHRARMLGGTSNFYCGPGRGSVLRVTAKTTEAEYER